MPTTDEQVLIIRAREGSVAAFGALVSLHQDRLYRFLLSRSNVRADAEDAMQEAFISAFRHLHSYNPRWQFSTWLYRIALRKLGKLRSRNAETHAPPELLVDEAANPLAACIDDDQKQNLWFTARGALGEQPFTALWLRYAEDLPVRDVARVMGRPVTWVKVTLHRARRRLASVLVAQEDGPHSNTSAVTPVPGTTTHGQARSQGTQHQMEGIAIKESAQ